jgi:hypothetical protein
MGTSASNAGLKGKTSLLPNWATGGSSDDTGDNVNDSDIKDSNDKSQDDKPDKKQKKVNSNPVIPSQQTKNWRSAKTAIKKYTGEKNKSNLKKSGRSYVKTYGGSKSAAMAAQAGVKYGFALGNFLGGFSLNGYEQNLREYGLADCIGKSSEEVLAKIADKIAPIGSTNDEAIARAAIMDSLDKLYEKILADGGDLDSLGSLDESALKDSVIEFTSNYIYKKWIYELGLVLEKNELSEKAVIQLENEIKVFIRSEVRLALKDKDIKAFDLNGDEGKKIVLDIFELAYLTIEK